MSSKVSMIMIMFQIVSVMTRVPMPMISALLGRHVRTASVFRKVKIIFLNIVN